MFNKFLLPPDVFFRHHLIASCVRDATNILDVGGSLGELRKFLPTARITTADVIPGADVLYDGKRLPFPNQSWNVVVSVDTLEHIPEHQRLPFVSELVRIAKRQVILIAPYGSVTHERYEGELVDAFKKDRKKIPEYLLEHRAYGLVSEEFCTRLKKEFTVSIQHIGLVSLDRINFKVHTFEFQFGPLNRLTYFIKFVWNVAENILLSVQPSFVMNPPSDQASRVIMTIEKP